MDAYQNLISGDKSPWEGRAVVSGGCYPNNNIIRKIDRKIKIGAYSCDPNSIFRI